MTLGFCRLLIRAAAWLAPARARDRFREEWLAELQASTGATGLLRRCLGAPRDAWSLRWTPRIAGPTRAIGGGYWWSGVSGDFWHAARNVRRHPGHAAAIVLCLAIGLTVAVSAFSLANALIFNDLPGLRGRTSLLRVFVSYDGVFGTEGMGRGQSAAAGPLSRSDLGVLDVPRRSLTGLAAEGPWNFTIAAGKEVVATRGAFVSADYFDVLGTPAVAGRVLDSADDASDAVPAVVLGYHLWRSRFQGRTDVVGTSVLIGGRAFAIVGVTPPLFTGIQPADIGQSPLDLAQLWLPDRFAAAWPGVPPARTPWFSAVARLAPGATRDEARAEMETAAARLSDGQSSARGHAHIVIRSHGLSTADGVGFVLLVVSLFMTLPLTVLAIGCANVANLQLARATDRARELTVRLVLGATRGQLVRLLSIEVFGLTLLGTVFGWIGAKAVLTSGASLFPLPLPLDQRVFGFACGLVLVVTAISGLAPAWLATRRATAAGLKHTAQSGGIAHAKLRSTLVVTQVALSLVLLFVAALSVRSLRAQLAGIELASRDIIEADVSLKSIDDSPAQARDFATRVVTAVAADSRVAATGVADFSSAVRYWHGDDDGSARRYAGGGAVSPGWFTAVSSRVLAGRALADADEGRPVAVITEGLALELWPSGPAVGHELRVQRSAATSPETVAIVGVVADRRAPDGGPERAAYLPMREPFPTAFTLVVRSPQTQAMIGQVRRVLSREEPRLSWVAIGSEVDKLSGTLLGLRYILWLFSLLSALALGLASAGLFAVMGYTVTLRRRELAVRLAIGAGRADLISLVLGQAIRLVTVGAVIGFALAIPLAIAMRALLVGVSPVEPLAVLPTLAVLVMVALGAGFVPARRAAAIDPLVALKED